jgi:2-keto-4-pentenoate hydratase/2-oxohepta-3-ene-1,7-dioic acid hydratase in catechol pathway
MSFEQHNLTAARLMGATQPPQVIYKLPVYYKGNHFTLVGHEAEISWPGYSDFMDFELELGFVIRSGGVDLNPDQAEQFIFGVTILNDFSARDRQVEESSGGLGPAKGKDFVTAIGPWVTTVDELNLADLTMTASVNGEKWATGSSGSAMWSPAELVAYASTAEHLVPGELLGSGTLGGGCGVEAGRRLISGDLIELEVSGIGTLRNRIVETQPLRWTPTQRTPGVTITGGRVTGPTRPMSPRLDAAPLPVVLDSDGHLVTQTPK